VKSSQLTARKIATAKKPGYYGDGGGLYLQVSKYGTKSWVFRFMINRHNRDMGLGSLETFSLKEVRERARECRKLVADGLDPIKARQAKRDEAAAKEAARVTFEQAATRYISAHSSSWKNEKHRAQWASTLEAYAYPVMGKLSVDAIELPHVLKVLEPIWTEKPETANRVRGRIERVLAWATVRKYRKGDNPARWTGHLDEMLPSKQKLRRTKHHAALPFAELPAFMAELRARNFISARALEFTILTAARTSEAIKAKWKEIDLKTGVWTLPGERMKSGKEHEVPLSKRAIAILESLPREDLNGFVFIGAKSGACLSNLAMLEMLRGMRGYGLTVHGFRSTFRDWAGDRTNYARDVIEHALAHRIKDKAEASYRRASALEKRRRLMEEWARYCAAPVIAGELLEIGRA
jgi:integrase